MLYFIYMFIDYDWMCLKNEFKFKLTVFVCLNYA